MSRLPLAYAFPCSYPHFTKVPHACTLIFMLWFETNISCIVSIDREESYVDSIPIASYATPVTPQDIGTPMR